VQLGNPRKLVKIPESFFSPEYNDYIVRKIIMADCYNCKFRGEIPGSAHSCCEITKHIPALSKVNSEFMDIALMIGKAKIKSSDGTNAVKLNPEGVKNGWASWPLDFDPVWITSCELFKPKPKGK
jgi:hypothetical protein